VKKKLYNLLDFTFSSQGIVILVCEILVGIIAIAASSLLFADIAKDTLFDKQLVSLDMAISQFFYSFRTPLLTQVMVFISFLGADFILVISTIIVILFSWRKHKHESVLFSIMLIFGAILNVFLKQVFQRPRPTIDPLIDVSSYSFPSGHAMNSLVFYLTLAYFTYHFTRRIKYSFIAMCFSLVIIALIGLSRVYLGVHYPTDVAAGYVAGLLWFVLVLLMERTLRYATLYKNYRLHKRK